MLMLLFSKVINSSHIPKNRCVARLGMLRHVRRRVSREQQLPKRKDRGEERWTRRRFCAAELDPNWSFWRCPRRLAHYVALLIASRRGLAAAVL
jgi:hypothetical protein